MKAREFYDERISEDPTINIYQLMEEYAKHIREINCCNRVAMQYHIEEGADSDQVSHNVTVMLSSGWELYGPMQFGFRETKYNRYTWFAQAMIKRDREDE